MAITLVGLTWTAPNASVTEWTIEPPEGVQPGDVLVVFHLTRGVTALGSVPSGWTVALTLQSPGGSATRSGVAWHVYGDDEPSSYQFSTGDVFTSFSSALVLMAFRGVDPESPIDAIDVTSADGTNSITSPGVTTTVPKCAVLHVFGSASGSQVRSAWSLSAGEVLWSIRGRSNIASTAAVLDFQEEPGETVTYTGTLSTPASNLMHAYTVALRPVPPAPTEVAGRLGLAVDLTGTVHQAHQIAGRFGALASLVGEVQVPALIRGRFAPLVALDGRVTADSLILGRLDLAAGLAGALELPTMVRGRFTAVVDLRGTVQTPTRITGRLEPLLDLRGMVHTPSQIRGRLAADLALWGTLQTPAQISGRLDLVAGLHGAVAVATEVRGRLLVLPALREVATGPGTGIVADGLTEDGWLAALREGDTFRVIVPSAVPWGRTALARVLGRELDAAGRLTLVLQLEGWPEPQRVLVQDTVSVPRYQPATALDPARRIVQTERAVAQVAARTTE